MEIKYIYKQTDRFVKNILKSLMSKNSIQISTETLKVLQLMIHRQRLFSLHLQEQIHFLSLIGQMIFQRGWYENKHTQNTNSKHYTNKPFFFLSFFFGVFAISCVWYFLYFPIQKYGKQTNTKKNKKKKMKGELSCM